MKSIILISFFTFMLPLHAQRSDFEEIDFWRAEYIANRHKGEELYNLPLLVHGLTTALNTDVERFRAIYYWVCHNIEGDYMLMYKNNQNRRKLKHDTEALQVWNNTFKKEVFTRLLQDKETLCTGYAYLIKELSTLAGLECKIINGYGLANHMKFDDLDAPNHSWNVVQLDGKWYLCDATWSSGLIDMLTLQFEFKFDDSYFLMEPSEFAKTHQPIDKKWALFVTNSKANRLP